MGLAAGTKKPRSAWADRKFTHQKGIWKGICKVFRETKMETESDRADNRGKQAGSCAIREGSIIGR